MTETPPQNSRQGRDAATEPLWDATFRARLLRQGLSTDEMAQAVEVAESAAAERDRYRSALERIYQQGRGPHVAIAREALNAS